jgi:hypothetical protein
LDIFISSVTTKIGLFRNSAKRKYYFLTVRVQGKYCDRNETLSSIIYAKSSIFMLFIKQASELPELHMELST